MGETVVVADKLTKTFTRAARGSGPLGSLRSLVGRRTPTLAAVDQLSFRLARGEMVGFIGPNGAGKSTAVKMLTGILVPSDGRLEVFGLEPHRRRTDVVRRMGVVFGQRTQLWWDLPLRASLELLRHVYAVPRARFAANLAACRELLELDSFLDTPVRQLSLGQRMRGELTGALLHEPELLLLDEPTIGLDVVAKQRMRDVLLRMNRERGVTVLLTTHDLVDVERLCSRLLVLDHGRLLFDGSLTALADRFGAERTLVVELLADPGVQQLELAGLRHVRRDGARHWLRFARAELTATDAIARVAARYPVRDLAIEEPDIESIIGTLYARGVA